jgi:hypothetical protein
MADLAGLGNVQELDQVVHPRLAILIVVSSWCYSSPHRTRKPTNRSGDLWQERFRTRQRCTRQAEGRFQYWKTGQVRPLSSEELLADIRCVQINLPAEGRDDPAAWPEVVNKIKESVVLAFDAAIVEREEEVKRGEAQRMMVGWNFCTWFLLKVGVPSSEPRIQSKR